MLMKTIKKIIKSAFLLYAFNMILINFNIVIPINVWSIIYVSFFDLSGVIILLIMMAVGV